jgi:hypothetical protein
MEMGIGSALQGLAVHTSCTLARACNPNMCILFARRALSAKWATSFGSVTESRNRSMAMITSAAGAKTFRVRDGKGKQSTVDPIVTAAVVRELQFKPRRSTCSVSLRPLTRPRFMSRL